MNPLLLIGGLLEKIIPDVNARKKARELLVAADQKGELDLLLGQLEINKVEAASDSLFVAGWRPATGWICALALGYNFIVSPFLDIWFVMPEVDVAGLYPILMGMLGLGGLRSFEKFTKVSREK